MSNSEAPRRPLVACLGNPDFVGEEYLAEFKKDFDFEVRPPKANVVTICADRHLEQVVPAMNRKEAQEMIPQLIEKSGPIDAMIVRMGTVP